MSEGPGEVERVVFHEDLKEDDKRELGEKLAKLTIDIQEVEEEKSDVNSAFNSKLKTMHRQVNEGAQVLNQGFRVVEKSAIVTIDIDTKKRYYRDPQTGSIIKEEDLKPGDQPDLQW